MTIRSRRGSSKWSIGGVELTGTLQNLRQEDFLKVYWTSRHGLVLLDDIFERVKETCRTPQEAQDLSIDLLEAAEHYAALDEPDDAVWSNFGPGTKKLIGNLRVLGSKLVRPVILSGLKKLDPQDFERLLKVLEIIVVRWQLIGEGRTGTIERACARLASLIWDGKIKNKTGFVETLSELYTTDDDFRDSFIAQDNLANQKAAYLLRRIEEYERSTKRGGAGSELIPGELSLEHVLPKNRSQDWADVIRTDPTIVEDCVGRIGNMCLLMEARNREAGRQGFSKKRPVYQASELLITQRMALAPDWDRKAIEHHQTWLASRAVTIWKLN